MTIFKIINESKPIYLLYWLAIAIILLLVDFFSGPFIQFPISYLIPVALASWYKRTLVGVIISSNHAFSPPVLQY